MSEQTGGTLTFLFSDVEGSTRMLREFGDDYPAVQARQQSVLSATFLDHGGRVATLRATPSSSPSRGHATRFSPPLPRSKRSGPSGGLRDSRFGSEWGSTRG